MYRGRPGCSILQGVLLLRKKSTIVTLEMSCTPQYKDEIIEAIVRLANIIT